MGGLAGIPAVSTRCAAAWRVFVAITLLLFSGLFGCGKTTEPTIAPPPPVPTSYDDKETPHPIVDGSEGTMAGSGAIPSGAGTTATGTSKDVPAGAGEEAAGESDYVWNYWLTSRADTIVPWPNTQPISLKARQRLEFRLSSYDLAQFYKGLQTVAGSPQLRSKVAEGIADPLRHTLELDVLVQSTDDSRLRIDPSSRRTHLSIDLDAQRGKSPQPPAAGTAPSQKFLYAARLAEFGIDFMMLEPGTHEVGIVIVDASSGFPLQTMVASIADASTANPGVRVRGNGQVGNIADSAPADLSLYLYDLSSHQDNIFTRSLNAQLYYRSADGNGLVTWHTEVDITGLRSAAHTLETVGSTSTGADLLQAGVDFGRLIFNTVDTDGKCEPGTNCAAARRAREVITAAANYPKDQLPPTMVVRIISGETTGLLHYASDVFPFGAMGVSLDEKTEPIYLGERFALALVLSDQQFAHTTTCPRRWYFALPRAADHPDEGDPLGQALIGLAPLLGRIDPATVGRQSEGLTELRDWFSQNEPKGQRSYVFVYVGHDDDGHLYLRQGARGIDSGSIARTFERASVAILDACNSAMRDVSNGTPIGRLARLHVDSTIATTSPISGGLAADYLDCLDAVLDGPHQLTVGQAHALATQCLWSSSSSERWHRHYDYQGAALKYLLIGDPNQPLCPPPRETSP